MNRRRIAVLASGGGSNLQALLDHFAALGEERAGDIVLVASNSPGAGALVRARAAGIPDAVIATARAPGGEPLAAVLDRGAIDVVVLAGYLQLVPAEITRRFAGRMLNVHPAPLPEFGGPGMYGRGVHRAVLASGAWASGPTVHFVDDLYDHGIVIAHWPVPVLDGDDEHTLGARVLRAEHLLFPRVVQAVVAGTVTLDDGGNVTLALFDPLLDDALLGRLVDQAMSPSGVFRPPSIAETDSITDDADTPG